MFLTHTKKPGTKWRKCFNSYNANFIGRALIYGLIFKVQNKLNLLEGKEVWPIKMTKSDFLDAKHISDYAMNIYEASDADRGDLFLPCHQNDNLILFFAFLKVSKFRKQIILSSHCPKNQRNFSHFLP